MADAKAGKALYRTPTNLTGTYVSFPLDEVSGAWAYTLDKSDPDVNSLTEGQSVSDNLTVTLAVGATIQTVVVTLTKANNEPDPNGSLPHPWRGSASLL